MRLIANENIPGDAVVALRAAGHDVAWVRELMPGAADAANLARAQAESRVSLTFDRDFGELAFRAGLPATSGVILLRIQMPPPDKVGLRIADLIAARSDWEGKFSVVEDGRVRMRDLPR